MNFRLSLSALLLAASTIAIAQSLITRDMQPIGTIEGQPGEFEGVVLKTLPTADGAYAVIDYGSSLSVLKFGVNGQVLHRASELNASAQRVWLELNPSGGLYVLSSNCTLLSYSADLNNRFRVDAEAPTLANTVQGTSKLAGAKSAQAKGGFACNGMALNQNELLVQSSWPTQALLRFSTQGQYLGNVAVTQNALPASVHYLNRLNDKIVVLTRDSQGAEALQALDSALQPAWQFMPPAGQSGGYVLTTDADRAVIRTWINGDFAVSIVNSQGVLLGNVLLPPLNNLERWHYEFGTLWLDTVRYVAGQRLQTIFSWRPGDALQTVYESPEWVRTALTPIDENSAVFASSVFSTPFVETQTIRRISRNGAMLGQSTQNADHFITAFLRLPNAQWRILGEKARRDPTGNELLGSGQFRLAQLDVQDFHPLLLPGPALFFGVSQVSNRTFLLVAGKLSALDARGKILWQREADWSYWQLASAQGAYLGRAGQIVHVGSDGQDLWAQTFPAGCGTANLRAHAQRDAVWLYCVTDSAPAQFKLIQVSAAGLQEFASFAQAPDASIFDLDGFGNATELQPQPMVAVRRSNTGREVWRIPLMAQESILLSDDVSITTRRNVNLRQFVYTRRNADGSVAWQHNIQTPCYPWLLLPNASTLHEACLYEPNEPQGVVYWHSITDAALALPFKSISRPGARQLRDILDLPNGEQWLQIESAQGAQNKLFHVDSTGSLLEEWSANATFYNQFPSRKLWQTQHGVFLAIEADVPGKGQAVQIYRASDEFFADGFE